MAAFNPNPVLSIVISYFHQSEALAWQLELFENNLLSDIELVVVDDGTNDSQLLTLLRDSPATGTLIQIARDVPWNLPGARNWGMVFASARQCLRTDIDHRPTPALIGWMREKSLTDTEGYRFERIDGTGRPTKPHGDSYFLTKAAYWMAGGYDEHLSGFYGQNEVDFLTRASRVLELNRSPHALETRVDLRTNSRSRLLWPNWIRYQVRKRLPYRKIRRLSEEIEVNHF